MSPNLINPYRFASAPAFNPLTGVGWTNAWYAEGPEFAALGVANGGAVSSWPDEISTADLAQASGTLQPLYTAAAAGLNSQPAITFDSSDDYMKVTWGSRSQPFSLVMIGRGARTGTRTLLSGDDTTREHAIDKTSTPNWRIRGGTDVVGGTPDTTKHLFNGFFSGASSDLLLDGTSVAAGNAGAEASQGLVVSARYDFANQAGVECSFIGWYTGDVRSDGGWTAFKSWAATKYAMTIA